MQFNTGISTEKFAARYQVKSNSVRSAFCRDGHYFGIVPTKLPNGRLSWPDQAPKTGEKQEGK